MPKERKKPQPTLTGYCAWVFDRLVETKDDKPGKVAGWIIERWIDENRKLLDEQFDIRREQYHRAGKAPSPIGGR